MNVVFSPMPCVLSVGTAVPNFRFDQQQIREMVRGLFGDNVRDFERLLNVFDNGHIGSRYLSAPIEWFAVQHSWSERNELYVKTALDLSTQAALIALERANKKPEDIDAIFFVSTTGLATPSLDSWLIKRLNLSRHVVRVPIWGLGCAGGASGLNRATEFVRANSQPSTVLLVAVECSSLTFQPNDYSRANLISSSLFADGAAAVVVSSAGTDSRSGPVIIGGSSTLWDNTEDVMGWVVTDTGLRVQLAQDVPGVVRKFMLEDVNLACEKNGVDFLDVRHFVTHPGGEKVMQAFTQTLNQDDSVLNDSRIALFEHGNMSSPTVLFALERFLRRWPEIPTNELGLLTAMGPGFSSEHVLFRT